MFVMLVEALILMKLKLGMIISYLLAKISEKERNCIVTCILTKLIVNRPGVAGAVLKHLCY